MHSFFLHMHAFFWKNHTHPPMPFLRQSSPDTSLSPTLYAILRLANAFCSPFYACQPAWHSTPFYAGSKNTFLGKNLRVQQRTFTPFYTFPNILRFATVERPPPLPPVFTLIYGWLAPRPHFYAFRRRTFRKVHMHPFCYICTLFLEKILCIDCALHNRNTTTYAFIWKVHARFMCYRWLHMA